MKFIIQAIEGHKIFFVKKKLLTTWTSITIYICS
jgi:hypothetical protein